MTQHALVNLFFGLGIVAALFLGIRAGVRRYRELQQIARDKLGPRSPF